MFQRTVKLALNKPIKCAPFGRRTSLRSARLLGRYTALDG